MFKSINKDSLGYGFLYFALMLIAIIYFEIRIGFLNNGEYFALSAYLPAVISCFVLGLMSEGGHRPVSNNKNCIEAVLTSIMIILVSIVVASFVVGFVAISGGAGSVPSHMEDELLVLLLAPGIIFVFGTWHILLAGILIISFVLCQRKNYF